MKKMVLITLTLLLAAGPALAGPVFSSDAPVAVGTAQISEADLAALRDMVAGRSVARTVASTPAETVDVGVVELPRRDVEQLRAMVSGDFAPAVHVARLVRHESVNVGKAEMDRGEFEALKRMVSRHLHEDLHLSALID